MATYSNRGMRVSVSSGTTSFSLSQVLVFRAPTDCAYVSFCVLDYTDTVSLSLTTQIRNKDNLGVTSFSLTSAVAPPNINVHWFKAAASDLNNSFNSTRLCNIEGHQVSTGFAISGTNYYSSVSQCVIIYPGEYVYFNNNNASLTGTASWVAYTNYAG